MEGIHKVFANGQEFLSANRGVGKAVELRRYMAVVMYVVLEVP
jgi:hypothetical protein